MKKAWCLKPVILQYQCKQLHRCNTLHPKHSTPRQKNTKTPHVLDVLNHHSDSLSTVLIADLKTDLQDLEDRKSTRLNSSHVRISYAVFCLKKKKKKKK